MTALNPTYPSCVSAIWLVNLGYTLELVPLIVKVGALNRLSEAARSLRRVIVRRKSLFRTVAFIMAIMVLFLALWTVMDPPQRKGEYELSKSQTAQGETIVNIGYYCSSESEFWTYSAAGWNCLLLLSATVLAFQTRKIHKNFNESQTLAFMIYSHLMFVMLRVISYLLSGSVRDTTLHKATSLIYSMDAVLTLIIYFLPKFVYVEESPVWAVARGISRVRRFLSSHSSASGGAEESATAAPNVTHSGRAKPFTTAPPPLHHVRDSLRGSNTLAPQVPCPHCGRIEMSPLMESLEEDDPSMESLEEDDPSSMLEGVVGNPHPYHHQRHQHHDESSLSLHPSDSCDNSHDDDDNDDNPAAAGVAATIRQNTDTTDEIDESLGVVDDDNA